MQNLKLVLLVLSLLFSCKVISAQTAEQNFNKGVDYDKAGNHTEAVKWYRKAANQGYAQAQYNLGCCYEEGEGVKQNYTEAVKWYRKAANQGVAQAQYNLGGCYEEGDGVKQNYTEAVKWYRKAANQGYAQAQYNLGCCYEEGEGVKQNYTEAVKWYRKAANQGVAQAQYNLGGCYEEGDGVKQNYTEAVKWYRKAANQGYAQAQYNLGCHYLEGEGVKQNYTEAVKWFRKAAEQGFDMAQYNLGGCYAEGYGVKQNYTEAVKWFRKAAEQGVDMAQYELGICYYSGKGVKQNQPEAVKWFRKAANQGHTKAQYCLGYLADPDFEAGLEAEKNKIQSSSSSTSSTISSSSSSTTYTPRKYITDKFDIAVEFGGGLGVTEDYDYAIGHNIHLNVFGLYNFNENFLLGLGTGFRGFSVSETYDYINEWDMRGFDISIPIYLRAQYTFADKWSFRRPFVSCDFGWMFPISDEYFSYEKYLIEPHIGIKYDNQITFSLGCTILNAAYPWEYDNESKTICSISAKLGVVF